MIKKEIQEKRIRGYFIDATKTLLKGEGLKSISVRNIADRAGYSYATLYNHFNDVKDLIFVCVNDFQVECAEFIRNETAASPRGIKKIGAIINAYVKYFVQYPGIFDLFFLEKISDITNKQSTVEMIYYLTDRLCSEEWTYCIDEKIVSAGEAETLKAEIRNVIAGLLLFYINRGYPENYQEFTNLTQNQINHILDR
ncbi:MAG: TetR/AcrR family transcriptional regulator [Candidatus Neomarinimicrobiota bacterium]